MEDAGCFLCRNAGVKELFKKKGSGGETYTLVKCRGCGLEFVSPRPSPEDIRACYGMNYFENRTDRGYNDYFSDETRLQIERVMAMNLHDMGFFEYEESLSGKRTGLDIGCAAGYFVGYLKERGWRARGIDVSTECVTRAAASGLDVIEGDYLTTIFPEKFDLVTLWATIEHLHHPDKFIDKIHGDLKEGGMLYISTCRSGGINFKRLFGRSWRYYNFPEHLYFFSYANLLELLKRSGFKISKYVTYGSGVGKQGSALKSVADYAAKKFYAGDMMLVAARRV